VALVRAGQILVRVVVVGLCLTAAAAITALLSRHLDSTGWRILATTSAISFFGLLSVPVGTLLERGRATTLARMSGGLTLVTFLVTLVVIWAHWTAGLGKTWGVLMTLATATAQACAVEARRRDNDTPAVKGLAAGSVVTGAVLAALGVVGILGEIDNGGYFRLLGAVAILDVLLIVVAAVLRRGTGPIRQTHALRVDGRLVEVAARDFATAAALAIREAERDGTEVRRVERA
jgi:hypothetical protein